MSQDALSRDQFGLYEPEQARLRVTGRTMQWMRPSELLPYADDRTEWQDHVDDLAGRISRQGYRGKALGLREHIHLVHQSDGLSALANGNHRVRAMTQMGYDKPVPVLVSDRRPKIGPGEEMEP